MLNPDLQNEMEMEIEKAPPAVGEFLKSKYFEDTLDLITRVNKLSSEQRESLELECILHVLGQNDKNEVSAWVAAEVLSGDVEANKQHGEQIVKDIQAYVLDKVPGFKSLSSVQNNFEMGAGIAMDNNRKIGSGSLRDQIISDKEGSILNDKGDSYFNTENNDDLKTYIESAPVIKEGDVFRDVYREMAQPDDKTPRIG